MNTPNKDFVEPETNQERDDLFVSYLSAHKDTTFYIELYTIEKDYFYLFLNIFAGRFCNIPRLQTLTRMKKEANIYYDMRDNSLNGVSNKYDMSRNDVKEVGDKVRQTLEDYEAEVDTQFFQNSLAEYKKLKGSDT